MKLKHLFATAFHAIAVHKSRSMLTTLGIIIGVSSIIIVMSLGNGAQALILDQISGLGAESVVIRPGKSATDFSNNLFSRSLTESDVDALKRKSNVPNLISISPFVMMTEAVEYRGDTYQPSLLGGSAEVMTSFFDMTVTEGKLYDESDIERYAKVAVIGADLRDEIFENRQALGESIRIKGQRFRVIGIFPKKGSVGGFNFDTTVMIPHTTALRYVTGTDYYNQIIVKADSVEQVDKMVFDITTTLRDEHDIRAGDEQDFNVQTQENLIDQIQLITSILTAFLAATAAISLVVGGVGIMNIMLVSVTERTKEIGLRKALGARRNDIERQFLLEAIMLTGLGGLIGIMLGALISFIASLWLSRTVAPEWAFTFPLDAAALGIVVSGGIGLLFGLYPAKQAAKKSPIEALRYE